ncbi:hypothetical protein Scep_014293 [Stephania cephalantha]|uniref:Uncharacterized protein n=1 Tax=Stephania cephalantha TaxID=152367 RepID=A0AAP0J311_9MAGN
MPHSKGLETLGRSISFCLRVPFGLPRPRMHLGSSMIFVPKVGQYFSSGMALKS